MSQLSVWEKESFFAPQDVIIAGSGFTGLWSALKLIEKNPHLKITILERGIIPTGASTRNAGFSCFGSPSELLHDVALMGEDKTFELVDMRYRGLRMIREYFPDDITGFDASGGFECFTNKQQDWEMCRERLAWLNEKMKPVTGHPDTFKIADEKLDSFGLKGFDHLTQNQLEGGLHSGWIVQALLKKVQCLGVQVLTGITITGFQETNGKVQVVTATGIRFWAEQLLLCTNAFTRQLLPGSDIVPNRGQVFVTSGITGLALRGTFHFDRGFYYFRNLGNRLLIGGARNKALQEESTLEMGVTDTVQEELEAFVKKHISLPGSYQITDRWSGTMAMGNEKMPIVEKISEQVFCCIRMSGMGVALAPVVAEQVALMMTL